VVSRSCFSSHDTLWLVSAAPYLLEFQQAKKERKRKERKDERKKEGKKDHFNISVIQ
jgi:hypothetical protein